MRVHGWLRPHRSVLVLLLAVTCVPAAALIWVSWRMLEQDRALAAQRLQERLEHGADVAVSALDRRVADLHAQLPAWAAAPPVDLPADAVVLVADQETVRTHPAGRLLWQPGLPPHEDTPAPIWQNGERLEFQQQDYAGAARAYRALTSSRDARIRAGAFVRLGRTLRKGGLPREALAAYGALRQLGATRVGGAPAELIGEYGAALVLRERGGGATDGEWRQVAEALHADLQRGRWPIDRPTYEFYAGEVRHWLGEGEPTPASSAAAALSAAAGLAWQRRNELTDAGGAHPIADGPPRRFIAIWRRTPDGAAAIVAGSDYIASSWNAALQQPRLIVDLLDADGQRVLQAGAPPAKPFAVRAATDTGLPWTIRVASVDPAAELAALATPRRLLVTGLVLIACVVSIGVYAVARAVARELAVARLQSNFVAAVSHEFRSPITALRHLTEMLDSGAVEGDDRLRQYYQALARETERLHRLVDGLLDFGRMEAGRREYHFAPLDAPALVEHVVAEFAQDGGARRRVEVASEALAAHERAIQGDSGALTRAIWNLLDNAVKYSPPDSTVRVALARRNGRLCIHVDDEGPGIAAGERAEIFERFVRGSAARAAHVRGTGLGLAIVRHIARAHGGDVTLDSEPGRGSRFTIALPVEDGPVR